MAFPTTTRSDLRADAHQLLKFPAVQGYANVALERFSNNEATEIQKMIQALPTAAGEASNGGKEQDKPAGPPDVEVKVRPSRTNSERRPSRIQVEAPSSAVVAGNAHGKGEETVQHESGKQESFVVVYFTCFISRQVMIFNNNNSFWACVYVRLLRVHRLI